MKRGVGIWLVIAAALILVGGLIFGGAMMYMGWDFTKLSTDRYETRTHTVTEAFSSVSVEARTADVTLLPSEDGECRVVCYEAEKQTHAVTATNGVLTVELHDERKWYERIGIQLGTPRITVYLPQSEYELLSVEASTGRVEIPKGFCFQRIAATVSTGDVSVAASVSETLTVSTTTGSIHVSELSAGAIALSVSTGRVTVSDVSCEGRLSVDVSTGRATLTDVACGSFLSEGDTGDVMLTGVIAEASLSVERSTGKVRLERCDAAEIMIETDTGDVDGTLLSEKIFLVETDTGSVDVPRTTAGGICEITTDTGDVRIRIVS